MDFKPVRNACGGKGVIGKMNMTDTPYSKQMPASQLHWIIADETGALTVESVADGFHVYENPAGVLTNNPPFPEQMFSLNNYMNLSPKQPQNQFAQGVPLHTYSRGMGALGLPGDLSSMSRFARVAFVRAHSVSGDSEVESVGQFSISWALSTSREAAARSERESMS